MDKDKNDNQLLVAFDVHLCTHTHTQTHPPMFTTSCTLHDTFVLKVQVSGISGLQWIILAAVFAIVIAVGILMIACILIYRRRLQMLRSITETFHLRTRQ